MTGSFFHTYPSYNEPRQYEISCFICVKHEVFHCRYLSATLGHSRRLHDAVKIAHESREKISSLSNFEGIHDDVPASVADEM
jgi:hypothetical protein